MLGIKLRLTSAREVPYALWSPKFCVLSLGLKGFWYSRELKTADGTFKSSPKSPSGGQTCDLCWASGKGLCELQGGKLGGMHGRHEP